MSTTEPTAVPVETPPSPEKAEKTGCCGRGKKEDKEDDANKTKEPKDLKITQQTLPACKPVLRPVWVMTIFISVAVVFIPIGAVCLYYGDQATEVTQRYDTICMEQWGLGSATKEQKLEYLYQNFMNNASLTCKVNITIEEDMDGPIYLLYEINNFYQNFRRYVRSHMDQQLAQQGSWQKYVDVETQAQSCVPIPFNPDNDSQIMNPCGLVAWSKFNDSYTMDVYRDGSYAGSFDISDDGVAYEADIKYRFADIPALNIYGTNPDGTTDFSNIEQFGMNLQKPENRGGGNITGTFKEDQRFIAWMRLAHMPRFRKLWGVIDSSVKKGDVVTTTIINQFNTYSFSGEKSVVLTTTTWLGGNSLFLGAAYVAVGGLSFVMAIVYFIITKIYPRKLGDVRLLEQKHKGSSK